MRYAAANNYIYCIYCIYPLTSLGLMEFLVQACNSTGLDLTTLELSRNGDGSL